MLLQLLSLEEPLKRDSQAVLSTLVGRDPSDVIINSLLLPLLTSPKFGKVQRTFLQCLQIVFSATALLFKGVIKDKLLQDLLSARSKEICCGSEEIFVYPLLDPLHLLHTLFGKQEFG